MERKDIPYALRSTARHVGKAGTPYCRAMTWRGIRRREQRASTPYKVQVPYGMHYLRLVGPMVLASSSSSQSSDFAHLLELPLSSIHFTACVGACSFAGGSSLSIHWIDSSHKPYCMSAPGFNSKQAIRSRVRNTEYGARSDLQDYTDAYGGTL